MRFLPFLLACVLACMLVCLLTCLLATVPGGRLRSRGSALERRAVCRALTRGCLFSPQDGTAGCTAFARCTRKLPALVCPAPSGGGTRPLPSHAVALASLPTPSTFPCAARTHRKPRGPSRRRRTAVTCTAHACRPILPPCSAVCVSLCCVHNIRPPLRRCTAAPCALCLRRPTPSSLPAQLLLS
eukprot:359878-Chlamydomonas_euryale.AAC.5